MAKSIRSKHKRKMRAVKREKFGKKELERLKVMVEKAKQTDDVEMKELYIETSVKVMKEDKKLKGENMETNRASGKYNQQTMKNEHGNYPVWLHQRKVRKFKKNEKKNAKLIAKKKKSQV